MGQQMNPRLLEWWDMFSASCLKHYLHISEADFWEKNIRKNMHFANKTVLFKATFIHFLWIFIKCWAELSICTFLKRVKRANDFLRFFIDNLNVYVFLEVNIIKICNSFINISPGRFAYNNDLKRAS